MGRAVIAVVSAVTDAYAAATRPDPRRPLDVARARDQHAAYLDAMQWLGHEVVALTPDPAHPDAVFVEDQAVVVGRRALICRSGHPGRRAEAPRVAEALAGLGLALTWTPDPATLDGGDVLRLGDTLLVGRSARSDDGGLAALAAAFPALEVVPVALPTGVLHLKCVCSSPAPGWALAAPGVALDRWAQVIPVHPDDAWAANVVGAEGKVVVGAGFPRVSAALRGAGFAVREVELGELRAGDGSLTCLSILVG
ncbi:MAG: N(G),N(G)-dimethylarginine dimethylaminohydrolase [Myxococcota bacterium]